MKKTILTLVGLLTLAISVNAQIDDSQVEIGKVKVKTEEGVKYYGPIGGNQNFSKFEFLVTPTYGKPMFLKNELSFNSASGPTNTITIGNNENSITLKDYGLSMNKPHLFTNAFVSYEATIRKLSTSTQGFRAPSDFDFYSNKSWVENKQVIGFYQGHFNTQIFSNYSNYSLFVKGGILTEEVTVKLNTTWADYVFAPTYKLLSLKETEKYIAENKHLPNVPSAQEIEAGGVSLGEMANVQMEKIEELTLHLIQVNKEKEALEKRLETLEKLILNQ